MSSVLKSFKNRWFSEQVMISVLRAISYFCRKFLLHRAEPLCRTAATMHVRVVWTFADYCRAYDLQRRILLSHKVGVVEASAGESGRGQKGLTRNCWHKSSEQLQGQTNAFSSSWGLLLELIILIKTVKILVSSLKGFLIKDIITTFIYTSRFPRDRDIRILACIRHFMFLVKKWRELDRLHLDKFRLR